MVTIYCEYQLFKNITCHNTHTDNCFTALWILTGTTRVSRYQKKHSPLTPIMIIGHSLSASSIYYNPWHPPCSNYVPESLFPQSLTPSFIQPTIWPVTLNFILHIFSSPDQSSFCSTCPYHSNLFCCNTEIMSSNSSLSLNPLPGTLSCHLRSHIHITILISAC